MISMKSSMELKRSIGIFLILFSFALITWLLWPYQTQNHEIIFEPGELILNQFVDEFSIPGENQELPVFLNKIAMIIDWTPVIRKGDIGSFQLQVLQDFSLPDSVSETEMEISLADSMYVNVFEEYSVLASARMVLAELAIDPPGEIGTVLSEGQNVTFTWNLIPESTGFYRGTAWLYLDAFSNEGTQVINQAVSAQDFELKVVSLLGVNFIYLWITAFVLFTSGILLFMYPFNFLSDFTQRNSRKKANKKFFHKAEE